MSLGAGRLRCRTSEAQGLALPAEAVAGVAGAAYAAGVAPYLPLLPLITDRHVDGFTLAGTMEEVTDHARTMMWLLSSFAGTQFHIASEGGLQRVTVTPKARTR